MNLDVACPRWVAALGLAWATATAEAQVGSPTTVEPDALTTNDLLGVDLVGSQVLISPDGRWVVFQMRRTSVPLNQYETDSWLASTNSGVPLRQLTHNAATRRSSVHLPAQWAPDGRSIAYLADNGGRATLWLTHVPSLGAESLDVDVPVLGRSPSGGSDVDLKWSPDGKVIAFLSPAAAPLDSSLQTATTGLDVSVDWLPLRDHGTRLCTIDVSSRSTECLTNDTLNVLNFDWSPDGEQLVLSASTGASYTSYMSSDLYLLNRRTKRVTPLLKQPGRDGDPRWSPDGQWIAFRSQDGIEDWLQQAWPAVVSVSGGRSTFLGRWLKMESNVGARDLQWAADSKSLYFTAGYHMTGQLFRVKIASGMTERITPDTTKSYANVSLARGDSVVAFTMESVTSPPDIYVSALTSFAPRRIVQTNPRLARVAMPSESTISWQSSDGKWKLHGVVIRPPNYDPARKYPLLVSVFGGPGMVRMSFNVGNQHPLLVMASRGYIVFVPNTRGRPGYGEAFHHAIETEKSYGENPLRDVLDGVDVLAGRGSVDPQRVGILGFSYGGYLTHYAITQTTRFAAASAGDGAADLLRKTLEAGPQGRPVYQVMYGLASPHDSVERALIMRQSPLFNASRARTPIMLECGISGAAPTHCRQFLQALQHFKVPSILVVYPRTGHGINEPILLADSYRRNIEWFDYWLLGRGNNPIAQSSQRR